MSYVDDAQNAIQESCTEALNELRRMKQNAPANVRRAVEALVTIWRVPPPADQLLIDQMVNLLLPQVYDYLRFSEQLNHAFIRGADMLGSPDTLRATAEALSTVGGDARNLAAEVTKQNLPGMDPANWANSWGYEAAFEPQPGAVLRVDDFATTLAAALGGMADAIEKFYVEAALVAVGGTTAYVGLVGAITGVALCFTGGGAIAGLPMAIIGSITALLGAVSAILALASMTLGTFQSVNNQISALEGSGVNSGQTETWPSPGV